jgi:hypothetical protein
LTIGEALNFSKKQPTTSLQKRIKIRNLTRTKKVEIVEGQARKSLYRTSLDAPGGVLGWMKWEWRVRRGFILGRISNKLKKEEFPGIMKHAAWELLSPDLRCFCKHLCGKWGLHTRVLRGCGHK